MSDFFTEICPQNEYILNPSHITTHLFQRLHQHLFTIYLRSCTVCKILYTGLQFTDLCSLMMCNTFWALEQEDICVGAGSCAQVSIIVLMESIKASFLCAWHG